MGAREGRIGGKQEPKPAEEADWLDTLSKEGERLEPRKKNNEFVGAGHTSEGETFDNTLVSIAQTRVARMRRKRIKKDWRPNVKTEKKLTDSVSVKERRGGDHAKGS